MINLGLNQIEYTIFGVIAGLLLGLGLALLIFQNPWTRPRNVSSRIDPYVMRKPSSASQLVLDYPILLHPFVQRNLKPPAKKIARFLSRQFGSQTEISRRLSQAGLTVSVQKYRLEQVIWAVAGFGASAVVMLAMVTERNVSVVVALLMILLASLGGALARDYYLTKQVKRYSRELSNEFPAVIDLMALAVSAGEGPLAAMERVAKTTNGHLAKEMLRAVGDVKSGLSVEDSLRRLGERTPNEAIERFTDTVIVALERGTPLADVLRAQSQDARDLAQRDLMEIAGKREIYMLFPVVFFIMPLVILFAVFPGIALINLSF